MLTLHQPFIKLINMNHAARSILSTLIALLAITLSTAAWAFDIKSTEFTLANGLRVILIEDHRAPVVTHTVWYRVGGADEQVGKTGLAHFLEHLMFKGTQKFPQGVFDRLLDENGGEKNAFTMRDATAYYERVGADRLPLMMELEADRMQNLVLDDEAVRTELKVVQEERRQRTDSNPSALLGEQMDASLYLAHPYGRPVIGWNDDVARLTLADALDFYRAHYTPANAIVVIVGDKTPAEIKLLAEKYYGPLKNTFQPAPRHRTVEPEPLAARRLTMQDKRVANPSLARNYLAPSSITAKGLEAEALNLLAQILGDPSQGRLQKSLVLDKKLATSVAAWYSDAQLDSGSFGLYATPAVGTDLAKLEIEIDLIIQDLIKNGVTTKELSEAKERALAAYVFALDQPASFGNLIGLAAIIGQDPNQALASYDKLQQVSQDDILSVAKTYLELKRSVTGYLLPEIK